jgi:AbrB family looped-hinge helix DNA binding protein
MSLVRIKDKAQITLPVEVRRRLGVGTGDYVKIEMRGGEAVITPQSVLDRLPTFELSEEGERMLEEALDDVRAGRVKSYDSVEALIEDLHRGVWEEGDHESEEDSGDTTEEDS